MRAHAGHVRCDKPYALTLDTAGRHSVFAEFAGAFSAVLGSRFWPRVRWLLAFIIALAVLRSVVVDCNVVPSGSMIPTLLVGDRVLVNKLAYDLKVPFTSLHLFTWADPRCGDVIVFASPTTGIRLVKRVIGLPGDIVQMRDSIVYLNGAPLNYGPVARVDLDFDDLTDQRPHDLLNENLPGGSVVSHLIMEMPEVKAIRSFAAISVPAGKYFVMGDNRDDSMDSRYIGFVDRSQIVGRASRVVVSFRNYWSLRTGRSLQRIR
jgi:signal peptidase I